MYCIGINNSTRIFEHIIVLFMKEDVIFEIVKYTFLVKMFLFL